MDKNTGVIVALVPDETYKRYRREIALPHLTVGFLGRVSSVEPQVVRNFAKTLQAEWTEKLSADIAGITLFSTPDGWALVDLINAPWLPTLRALVEELSLTFDLPLDRRFGLCPHITRRYLGATPTRTLEHRKQNVPPFYLDTLGVWIGDEQINSTLR